MPAPIRSIPADRKTIQPSFPGAGFKKKFAFLVLQAGNTGYCNLQKETKK